MNLKPPSFDGRPIASIASLALALGIPTERLLRVSSQTTKRYRGPILVKKPGRKERVTWAALPDLRGIQQRVLDRIIKRAWFPSYLHGGLAGRSYIGNARFHARSKILFGQDIDSFYPSISAVKIEAIFVHVFHFPRDVAALLAAICCRNDELVQGGVASTHLANLALYKYEPILEARLRAHGLRYSRFVDDVHVSSSRRLARNQLTSVMSAMRSSLERAGFVPKRKKQFVVSADGAMRVHGLNVNETVSSPAKRRQQLRNEVFLLERWTAMQAWDRAIERCYLSLCSRIGHLAQMNSGEARRLKNRLNRVSAFRSQ
jgi:Reverse transcriptase (RNA-dependent DNA polymerase)